MNYSLSIRKWNVKPHLDIEDAIQRQKNGLLTFTIRLNSGNIVDVNFTEYVDPRAKYGIIKAITIAEFSFSLDSRVGSPGDTMGNDNIQCSPEERDSST